MRPFLLIFWFAQVVLTKSIDLKNHSFVKINDSANYSCKNLRPPLVENAEYSMIFHRNKGHRDLMIFVEYNCHFGYEISDENLKRVFCKKKQWVGQLPKCIKKSKKKSAKKQNTHYLYQADEPMNEENNQYEDDYNDKELDEYDNNYDEYNNERSDDVSTPQKGQDDYEYHANDDEDYSDSKMYIFTTPQNPIHDYEETTTIINKILIEKEYSLENEENAKKKHDLTSIALLNKENDSEDVDNETEEDEKRTSSRISQHIEKEDNNEEYDDEEFDTHDEDERISRPISKETDDMNESPEKGKQEINIYNKDYESEDYNDENEDDTISKMHIITTTPEQIEPDKTEDRINEVYAEYDEEDHEYDNYDQEDTLITATEEDLTRIGESFEAGKHKNKSFIAEKPERTSKLTENYEISETTTTFDVDHGKTVTTEVSAFITENSRLNEVIPTTTEEIISDTTEVYAENIEEDHEHDNYDPEDNVNTSIEITNNFETGHEENESSGVDKPVLTTERASKLTENYENVETTTDFDHDIAETTTEDSTFIRRNDIVTDSAKELCKLGTERSFNGNCVDIDECELQSDTCEHICENTIGSYMCSCLSGYKPNMNQCEDINECEDNHPCSHYCINEPGTFHCECPQDLTLQNSTTCSSPKQILNCSHGVTKINGNFTCTCPSGFVLGFDNKTCEDINECVFDDNIYCEQLCDNTFGSFKCSCNSGFILDSDNGNRCIDIDECQGNNGDCSDICINLSGSHKCECSDNFSRYLSDDERTCLEIDLCEIDNGNCSHLCEINNGQVNCSCPESFALINETQCVEINPCDIDNGNCSHVCMFQNQEIVCKCPDSHELINSTHCFDKDPCKSSLNRCSHYCKSTSANGVECSCPDSYILINETYCELKNLCQNNNGNCSQNCLFDVELQQAKCSCNTGYELADDLQTCTLLDPCSEGNGNCSQICSFDEEIKCSCNSGYQLSNDFRTCEVLDLCANNNGNCSHICRQKNNASTVECLCPPGYLLRPNKRVCKEINECRVNRGGCSHGCRNTLGSYECNCPQGFYLDETNNKTCLDVNECATNNGNCEMNCHNYKGSYRCGCEDGYVLQKDRKSCKKGQAVECRVPLAPGNGVIKCLGHTLNGTVVVPFGTRCNVYCDEGYKLEGRGQRICGVDGEWENSEATCIAVSCPALPPITNGWFMPGICNFGKRYIGESCSLHCRQGYQLKMPLKSFRCGQNLKWLPDLKLEMLTDVCQKGEFDELKDVYIKCPGNGRIEVVLPPGQRYMFVKIPQPETNVDFERYVSSEPSWGRRLETSLPVGETSVKFKASMSNRTVSCNLTINIIDKENPVVRYCPEDIEQFDNGNGNIVIWRKPEFQDNVGVNNVDESMEPGSKFPVGSHRIKYTASDAAGNKALCSFTVTIKDRRSDEPEVLNSIQTHSYTITDPSPIENRVETFYRAVLVCPSGREYSSVDYNNFIIREVGCQWKHVKVNLLLPNHLKIFSNSRLPIDIKQQLSRRQYFKWNR